MSNRASILDPVFVTGVGIVSPAGADTETTWHSLITNVRCVQSILDTKITGGGEACAGQVPGFVPPPGLETADRVCQLAVFAADQAMNAAGLRGAIGQAINPARTAVSFGTSKGGLLAFSSFTEKYLQLKHTFNHQKEVYNSSGHNLAIDLNATSTSHLSHRSKRGVNTPIGGINPLSVLSDIPPDAPARHLALRYGMTGGAHATVGACATGTLAAIRAVQMIRDGQADVVIAGAADASLHPLWFATFRRMGVLAKPHAQLGPAWACRPFDRDRSGFVIGEGAAAFVLESGESVRRRQVCPLACITGYAMGTDPAGLAAVNPTGAPLAEVIKIACRRAAIDPSRIVAVQAHGTGTPANDLAEMNAMHAAGLCSSQIPIASYKGAIGHLLGGAGGVELALSILAVSRGIFPGNATLIELDRNLPRAWLPTAAVPIGRGPLLKTSLGFGGHLAAVILNQA